MSYHTDNDSLPLSGHPMDESYWSAILQEGEYAKTAPISASTVAEATAPQSTTNSPAENWHADWHAARAMMDADETLSLTVTNVNRGGLLVEWRSLRGFVPSSQLINAPQEDKPALRQQKLSERIGDTLTLRIIELNPEKNRFILSERAAQAQHGARTHLLKRTQQGDIVEGRVTNLCDFGAFVDLGGVEGLIHISELSWGRVGHPSDVLARGQTVRAYVLHVEPDQSRIALSLKRLTPDPWATVEQRYRVGQFIEGYITNVVDFGAFACVEDGLEGLIHFSELAEGHFLHPRNVVKEGDLIRARILSIDGKARRLGLSLRAK